MEAPLLGLDLFGGDLGKALQVGIDFRPCYGLELDLCQGDFGGAFGLDLGLGCRDRNLSLCAALATGLGLGLGLARLVPEQMEAPRLLGLGLELGFRFAHGLGHRFGLVLNLRLRRELR